MNKLLTQRHFRSITLLIAIIGMGNTSLFSQTIRVFTTSGTFTVPACVTTLTVQCWGAGGGGGGADEADGGAAGSGGGGGGYATAVLTNVSGTYTVTVGTGGPGGIGGASTATNGTAGGSSIFTNGTVTVTGVGGTGGTGSVGGVATTVGQGGSGTFAGGVTGTTYKGGNGAEGNNQDDNTGGAGGGGAGNAGNGATPAATTEDNNGTGGAGGAGNPATTEYEGGAGGSVSAEYYENGGAGTTIGGGGAGGGGETSGGIFGHGTAAGNGGAGGNGQVIVSYSLATPTITSVTGSGCAGSTVTIHGTLLTGATSATIGTTALTNLTVTSSTVITGTIAAGTTSGTVTVNTPCGSVTSATAFSINSAPTRVNLGTHNTCSGTYTFGGRTYTTSGTYYDTTASTVSGCDSITSITLTIGSAINQAISQTVCSGGSYSFGGHSYNTGGTYKDTTTSVVTGCDSITTLTLAVGPPLATSITQNICAGSTYTFGGQTYAASGIYKDTTTSVVSGCDSITTLTLSVNQPIYRGINWSICTGESYAFNGSSYSTPGTYVDTLFGAAANGCDSIAALILTVLPNPTSTTNGSICNHSTYSFNGHTYSTPGVYADTLVAAGANGCDSIATLNLTLFSDTVTATATQLVYCIGDSTQICATPGYASYLWNTGDTSACFFTNTVGRFWVSVADTGGCTATSNLIDVTNYPGDTAIITAQGDTLSANAASAYVWYLDSLPISGGTSQSIIGTQSGNYTVQITDSNGCHATSVAYNLTVAVGINNLITESDVKVFPNPLYTGYWTVEVAPKLVGSLCEMFDADGRAVFKAQINNQHFEISQDIAKGVYILQIRSAGTAYNLKLIKLN